MENFKARMANTIGDWIAIQGAELEWLVQTIKDGESEGSNIDIGMYSAMALERTTSILGFMVLANWEKFENEFGPNVHELVDNISWLIDHVGGDQVKTE